VTPALDALFEAAESNYDAMGAGDLTRVGPVVRALEATAHPVARAWSTALRARLALTEPRYGVVPGLGQLSDFVEGPSQARRAATRATADALRYAVSRFESDRIAELAELAPVLTSGLGSEELLLTEWCLAWASYARGEPAASVVRCHGLIQRAGTEKSPALVVEALALRALATLEEGEAAEALALARRASLAARSEGLPQPEFFAHIVLARARRHARQSHLALRILEALRNVVTAPWRGFLCWEWLMSGGDEESALEDLELTADAPAGQCARALLDLLRAAAGTDAHAQTRARVALESCSALLPAKRDALTLIAASDADVPPPNAQLAAWRAGRDALIPPALHGLRLRSGADDAGESASAYAVRQVDMPPVRVLHWGLQRLDLSHAHRIPQSHRAQGRVETVLAVLALSEAARMPEAECFAQTYGFPFVPQVHRGVFDVLLHRARDAVGDAGTIHKDEGGLQLQSNRTLIIPDPRVSQRTADRVLRLLAERGVGSAKDLASSLGISLRAAQSALADLSEQGACETRKSGRAVAYVVEDTVFSEPTARLRKEQLTGLTTPGSSAERSKAPVS
jgi:hypothetical protein